MSGFLFMIFIIAGPIFTFDGVVQLCVRKKTGPWKEGGASLLAGVIIMGVSVFLGWLTEIGSDPGWIDVTGLLVFISGLVLLFSGVVQLCVRKKTGPWKEGLATLLAGASLLAGGIILGVSVLEEWGSWTGIYLGFLLAGLALAVNGVVKLCVRKKTGLWKEGLATLLAGAIIALAPILLVRLVILLFGGL